MNSYYGGALVVHHLHQEMDDKAFFTGLQSCVNLYGGGTASLEQFIVEMEKATGHPLVTFGAEFEKASDTADQGGI